MKKAWTVIKILFYLGGAWLVGYTLGATHKSTKLNTNIGLYIMNRVDSILILHDTVLVKRSVQHYQNKVLNSTVEESNDGEPER